MFKVSQEIYLSASDAANHSNVYGKYTSTPNDDSYGLTDRKIYVAPEVTEINKIQILHFPEGKITVNQQLEFIIKKNGARGNIDVKLVSPANTVSELPLQILDPERYSVKFTCEHIGAHKVQIRFNGLEIPWSPLPIFIESNDGCTSVETELLPIFTSDATKVKYRGLGLEQINLIDKNEFTIDGSNAGNNILFVGICGPKGQCDEVSIKHMGQNIYNVTYRVHDRGQYLIAAKWGSEDIPGSPFQLASN